MHVPISIGTEGAIRRGPLSLGTMGRLVEVDVEIKSGGGSRKSKIKLPARAKKEQELLLLIKVFLLCRS